MVYHDEFQDKMNKKNFIVLISQESMKLQTRIERLTVEKPNPKQLLRPITTGADSAMNQSQLLAVTCNSPEAREKLRVRGAIGFGLASHWLKNWRESFKPISKHSNRNHVIITFECHLKTALILCLIIRSHVGSVSDSIVGTVLCE